eukprot:TRINITY_DN8057_c0_g1_i1.p1 TRINITY_DN8057_c0_g1~~TRINITY_DN8057_c0_g1_i1.p1  ORF type:complete len:223 (+),score=33.52 TRINITY_DN8057_c0_g1_i1:89-757(+)
MESAYVSRTPQKSKRRTASSASETSPLTAPMAVSGDEKGFKCLCFRCTKLKLGILIAATILLILIAIGLVFGLTFVLPVVEYERVSEEKMDYNYEPTDPGASTMILTFDLHIFATNNNFYSIPARRLYLNVYIIREPREPNIYMGYVNKPDLADIPPHTNSSIVLPVYLEKDFRSSPEVAQELARAAALGQSMEMNFKGPLYVYTVSIPLDFSFSVPITSSK